MNETWYIKVFERGRFRDWREREDFESADEALQYVLSNIALFRRFAGLKIVQDNNMDQYIYFIRTGRLQKENGAGRLEEVERA